MNFSFNPINKKKIKNITNPYGTGGASKKIISILKRKNFEKLIVKDFFNLKFR